jgi:hypothetical protein
LAAFNETTVSPCSKPNFCHLDANSFLYRGLGPMEPPITCVNKILSHVNFGLKEIDQKLSLENIFSNQKSDPILSQIIIKLEKMEKVGNFELHDGILVKQFPKSSTGPKIVVPTSLVPFVLGLLSYKNTCWI